MSQPQRAPHTCQTSCWNGFLRGVCSAGEAVLLSSCLWKPEAHAAGQRTREVVQRAVLCAVKEGWHEEEVSLLRVSRHKALVLSQDLKHKAVHCAPALRAQCSALTAAHLGEALLCAVVVC